MDTVEINLENQTSSEEIKRIIGRELKFATWVKYNWDGFYKALLSLNDGLSLQSGVKFDFPLTLMLKNSSAFKNQDGEGYKTLEDILKAAKEQYREVGLEFNYILD